MEYKIQQIKLRQSRLRLYGKYGTIAERNYSCRRLAASVPFIIQPVAVRTMAKR